MAQFIPMIAGILVDAIGVSQTVAAAATSVGVSEGIAAVAGTAAAGVAKNQLVEAVDGQNPFNTDFNIRGIPIFQGTLSADERRRMQVARNKPFESVSEVDRTDRLNKLLARYGDLKFPKIRKDILNEINDNNFSSLEVNLSNFEDEIIKRYARALKDPSWEDIDDFEPDWEEEQFEQFDDIKVSVEENKEEIKQFVSFWNDLPEVNVQSMSSRITGLAVALGNHLIQNLEHVAAMEPAEPALPAKTTMDGIADAVTQYTSRIDYEKHLPMNDPVFQQIFSVYNGFRLIPESVYAGAGIVGGSGANGQPLRQFACFDETGEVVVYNEHPRKWNTITPLYGFTWTGPNSPNDKLPREVETEFGYEGKLLETFSFMHDASYQKNGWFDRIGDYKYISRLVHSLDSGRFQGPIINFVKSTIVYFSTVGTLLSMFNANREIVYAGRAIESGIDSTQPTDGLVLTAHFVNEIYPDIDMGDEDNQQLFSDTLKETFARGHREGSFVSNYTNRLQRESMDLLGDLPILILN